MIAEMGRNRFDKPWRYREIKQPFGPHTPSLVQFIQANSELLESFFLIDIGREIKNRRSKKRPFFGFGRAVSRKLAYPFIESCSVLRIIQVRSSQANNGKPLLHPAIQKQIVKSRNQFSFGQISGASKNYDDCG